MSMTMSHHIAQTREVLHAIINYSLNVIDAIRIQRSQKSSQYIGTSL